MDNTSITKTEAKSQFALNDKDLETVKCRETRHGVYKSSVYLYEIEDVKQKAIQKYGSEVAMNAEIEKRKERRETIRKNKENIQKQRRDQLIKNLKEHNLAYRSDSVLMQKYIEGGEKKISLNRVIDITKEINFYHTYTDYATILPRLRRQELEWMDKSERYFYLNRRSDEDEENLREQAKNEAMEKYVKKNFDRFKEASINIPLSLVEKADLIYNQIKLKKEKTENKPVKKQRNIK